MGYGYHDKVPTPPEGFVHEPELLTREEEAMLLAELEALRFDPIVLHGQAARRTARHFGLDYDYEARTPQPGEPVPDWLEPLRARAAELSGHRPEEFVEAIVQRYPAGSTIGCHRDAPAFGTVVGISIGGVARLRFQREKGEARRGSERVLEPRPG